jgi:hypothetical protein
MIHTKPHKITKQGIIAGCIQGLLLLILCLWPGTSMPITVVSTLLGLFFFGYLIWTRK